MRKRLFIGTGIFMVFVVLLIASTAVAGAKTDKCTTIQSGDLLSSTGDVLTTGYDELGSNYQAHQYGGYFGNYQRPPAPVDWGERLMMKWNDAWLSNKDCDGDGLLDRHEGFDSYIGSGAWLTNHQSGEEEVNGETCKWNYFVKIVAAPEHATKGACLEYDPDRPTVCIWQYWYAEDGTEIGEVIWGSFAIIQQVENDACAGLHGAQYISPDHPGLGGWQDFNRWIGNRRSSSEDRHFLFLTKMSIIVGLHSFLSVRR